MTDLDGYSTRPSLVDAGTPDEAPDRTLTGDAAPSTEAAADSSPPAEAGRPICRPGFSGPTCTTPCPEDTAGAACDFDLVLALDIPVVADWNVPGDIPWATDRTASRGPFERVAYRLVLDAEDVWVELDAFTSNPSKLGVPLDWIFDRPIENVVVRSFSPNQPSVLDPSSGKLEFWSNCYGEGADGRFDDEDVFESSASDCYGSMQIHVLGNPVLSFNHWTEGAGKNLDLGIGPGPDKSRDWTFAENAGKFQKRRLEVYVR